MKARYFFVIALAAFAIGIWQTAAHQRAAGVLASAIITEDTTGTDTTIAQQTLSSYVKLHMATSRQVFLSASYDKASQAAQAAANPASNGAVYAAAQAACASHADSLVQARCVQAYVGSHSSTGANPQAVAAPVKADYTKSFTAPSWTADSAGIALLAALTALVMGIYLAVLRRP
jgi:hypothetical protein